jgi:hypothetical protein
MDVDNTESLFIDYYSLKKYIKYIKSKKNLKNKQPTKKKRRIRKNKEKLIIKEE